MLMFLVFFVFFVQWNTTKNSSQCVGITGSSGSTFHGSRRAKPSPRRSFVFIKTLSTKVITTRRSASASTRCWRNTPTGGGRTMWCTMWVGPWGSDHGGRTMWVGPCGSDHVLEHCVLLYVFRLFFFFFIFICSHRPITDHHYAPPPSLHPLIVSFPLDRTTALEPYITAGLSTVLLSITRLHQLVHQNKS